MTSGDLEGRVAGLESCLAAFSSDLRLAYSYIDSDTASSLTKSRTVLEKLVVQVFIAEMGREPRKSLLGEILADNQFSRRIERRILSRMNAIRDLANLGPHGESVVANDAVRVLDDLCEVLDWFLKRYGQRPQVGNEQESYIILQVGRSNPHKFDPAEDRRIIIGRGPECDLCLDELRASRKHAMILFDRDKGWILQDLGSRNGVLLNRTRMEKAILSPGDELLIGSTRILVHDLR